MARQPDPKQSTLLMNPGPDQKAARVVPTRMLPMLGDRAILLTRRQWPDATLAWLHTDATLQTSTLEPL